MSFAISRFPLDYATPYLAATAIVERLRQIAQRLPEVCQLPASEGERLASILQRRALDILSVPAPTTVAVSPSGAHQNAASSASDHHAMASTEPTADDAVEVAHGQQVTLRFEARRCIHSRHCVLGQPEVFKANTPGEPIFPDQARTEGLAVVAQACPSGAITYKRHDGEPGEPLPLVNVARVRENGPLAFTADLRIVGQAARIRATLCRCGASKQEPYRDGSRTEAGFVATGEPTLKESQPLAARSGVPSVTPQENGPLQAEGNLELCCGTGHTIDRVTKT